jgi:hypothetical protein
MKQCSLMSKSIPDCSSRVSNICSIICLNIINLRSKLDKNGDNEGRDQLKRPGFSQSLKTKLNDILCKDKVDYKNLGEERKAAG